MDLNQLRAQRSILESQLNMYLSYQNGYEKEITATRGRLLRIMYKEYALETDVTLKASIKNSINREKQNHITQLNNRISLNKKNSNGLMHQIPKELAFKYRKLATNLKSIKLEQGLQNKAVAAGKVGINAASLTASALKVPIVTTMKFTSKVLPTIGKIAIQPLQIPTMLFSKLINPDKKYTGYTVTHLGEQLGIIMKDCMNKTADAVRKL